MRCKEWYGWHFPELVKVVSLAGSASPDGSNTALAYARCVQTIGDKSTLTPDSLPALARALAPPASLDADQDPDAAIQAIASKILAASRASMGTDISPVDLIHISAFADRVVSLCTYRLRLGAYLSEKMACVAPNLAALIGDIVGARLISHAGSLTNLAKYPASTVQILGAEKVCLYEIYSLTVCV